MDDPVSEEEFLARYDPRGFDLVAVTVDLVTLTVRDGAAAGAGRVPAGRSADIQGFWNFSRAKEPRVYRCYPADVQNHR